MRYDDLAATVIPLVRSKGIRLVSFDVFDTLVRRRCTRAAVHDRALAETRVRLAQRAIRTIADLHSCRELAIAELCHDAEALGLDPEFHIDDLYMVILRRAVGDSLTAAERAQLGAELAAFEVECERRAIVPIPGVVDQLRQIRRHVDRVVGVSDMYLGARHLESLLATAGFGGLLDTLYVSGDTGRYKATGAAFEDLLEREAVAAHDVLHIGDHEVADGSAPRRLGIATQLIRDPALYRARMADSIDRPSGNPGTAVALTTWVERDHRPLATPLEEYGRAVIGPIFAAFVHGVVDRAIADGVDCLYFLSRDGFLPQRMYEIAARSPRFAGHARPARYLVSSRLPSVRATMSTGFRRLAFLSARNQLVPSARTIRNTLRALDIADSVIDLVCTAYHIDADVYLDDELLESARLEAALSDPAFRAAAEDSGQSANRILLDYLRQEGVFDHHRIGLVDIGWGGTIQAQLHDVLSEVEGAPELFGYYFGGNQSMYDRRSADNRMVPVVSTVFPGWNVMRLGNSATFAAVGLVEEAARAPHGTCTGYERVDEQVVPVLKRDDERHLEAEGEASLAELQRGAIGFAHAFFDGVDFFGATTAATLALAHHALQRMVYHPTAQEITFWRALTHTNDIGGLFEITEAFLPPAEPWYRRPLNWRHKARASMWTHGAARYLLGAPAQLAYNALWTLSYARNVQHGLNLVGLGHDLILPRAPRRRSCLATAPATGTPTTELFDRACARADALATGSPAALSATRLLTPEVTLGALATVGIARVMPKRAKGEVAVVNDGLPVGLMWRRHVALLATPLLSRRRADGRPALGPADRLARRLLRC